MDNYFLEKVNPSFVKMEVQTRGSEELQFHLLKKTTVPAGKCDEAFS